MSKLFDMAEEIFWKLTDGQVIDIIDPGLRYGDYKDKNLHIIIGDHLLFRIYKRGNLETLSIMIQE